ncbi:HNH endonuclease signature motif containing protein [Eilatimonas milleporae]|uniref:HNH endonuclease n=1 Tax=Eilatimonas milleporae TaxID=911205 RepID=A0A3M0C1A4_9PROT|nr:HNH endonuclease signature motif containing protein [Eilatimonas milleporae]RMB02645.1 HNH endonuclease [Eilatimonas milleporae]
MDTADICPLCGRPFGGRVEQHHLIPRSKGGRETVPLHPICHRKIHSLFSETVLARQFNSIISLRAHPEIASFVKWLRGKPPDFHRRTAQPAAKRRRR